MKTSRTRGAVAAIAAAVMLAATLAWAAIAGVVTAVTSRDVTVSGTAYRFEDDTSVQDMTGQEISRSELRPGVPVELEFDSEGLLVTIRASVVR